MKRYNEFFERGEEYTEALREELTLHRNVLPSILLPVMQTACECYLDHVIINLYQYKSRDDFVNSKGVTHSLSQLYRENLFDRLRRTENEALKKFIPYDRTFSSDLGRLFMAYRNNRYVRPDYISEPDAADMFDFFDTVFQCKKLAEEFNEHIPEIFKDIEEANKLKQARNKVRREKDDI